MYIKNTLKFKVRNDIVSDNENCEIMATEIINYHSKNIIVISLYRRPGTDIDSFNGLIDNICSNLKAENKFVFWAGDFNINILNTGSHKATDEFVNIMMSNSFYPAITKPTRITEFSATIIDNIFCNIPANSFTGIMYN